MDILITNDDGIDAPGISVLAKAAAFFGNVTVVAPAHQQSAMSHRITLSRPMELESREIGIPGVTAYALDGAPADCIKAALDAILPKKPDVVLSGINHGYNVGYDIAYSGTVGAAMEALMRGIPAIALSRNDLGGFEVVEQYLHEILEELLSAPLQSGEIWNVNIPSGECRGILRDRTVAPEGHYNGRLFICTQDGKTLVKYPYMEPVARTDYTADGKSDLYAVLNGYISLGKVRCQVL